MESTEAALAAADVAQWAERPPLPWGSLTIGGGSDETVVVHAAECARYTAELAAVRVSLAHGAAVVTARTKLIEAGAAAAAAQQRLTDALGGAVAETEAELFRLRGAHAVMAAMAAARADADAAGHAALTALRAGELGAMEAARRAGAEAEVELELGESQAAASSPRVRLRTLQDAVRGAIEILPAGVVAAALSARARAAPLSTTPARATIANLVPRLTASTSSLARSLGYAIVRELAVREGRGEGRTALALAPAVALSLSQSGGARTLAATAGGVTTIRGLAFGPANAPARGGFGGGGLDTTLLTDLAGSMLRGFLAERLAATPYDPYLAAGLAHTVGALSEALRARLGNGSLGKSPLPLATTVSNPVDALRARLCALDPDADEDAWLDAPIAKKAPSAHSLYGIDGFIFPATDVRALATPYRNSSFFKN